MSDFSVKNIGNSPQNGTSEQGKYLTIKQEYNKFKMKRAKSDFANSPAAFEQEIEILGRLLKAASTQGKEGEIPSIETRIETLKEMLSPKKGELPDAYYYQPLLKKGGNPKAKEIIDQCRDENGKLDQGAQTVIKKLMQIDGSYTEDDLTHDANTYFLPSLIKACRGLDDKVSPSIVQFVIRCAECCVHPNKIISMIENFAVEDDKGKNIDSSVFPQFRDAVNSGLSEHEAISMLKYLKKDFSDRDTVKSAMSSLIKQGVDMGSIYKIVDALSIQNKETGKTDVSKAALDSVITLKRTLSKTSRNNRREAFCPISELTKSRFYIGEDLVIVDNGKFTSISADSGKTPMDYEREYLQELVKQENAILVTFAEKFKDEKGEINPNYLRAITILRKHGVTNGSILDFTTFCVPNGEIDAQNLGVVSKLKSAGALCKDIPDIIASIGKNDQNNYDIENLQNACDLTSAVIGGKEVVSLLPMVKGNGDIKDLAVYLSSVLGQKSNVVTLISLIKKNDETVDSYAPEVLRSLAYAYQTGDDNGRHETDFVNKAGVIIAKSKNPETGLVEENASDICSIMCQNQEPVDNIIKAIDLCKDEKGIIDNTLSDTLWSMIHNGVPFDDIQTIISSCKKDNNVINTNLTQTVSTYWKSGVEADAILRMLKSLAQE